MLTLYIADVERDAGMKKLSREEATKVLEGMKVKIEIQKAAVTQWERNAALDMAIEVLNCSEIPNKSDTISRQAALDAIMRQPPEPHYPAWYAAQIEKLPTVQPEPHWIPCSERLPKETGEYLVTKISIGWNYEDYTENDIAYWDNHKGFCKAEKVIAWMPIPPYSGGDVE